MTDNVNNPPHYNYSNIECIEAIRESMTNEQFIGHCKAQVYKYTWRMEDKNGREEDVRKGLWYYLRMIEAIESLPLQSLRLNDV